MKLSKERSHLSSKDLSQPCMCLGGSLLVSPVSDLEILTNQCFTKMLVERVMSTEDTIMG